MRPLRTVTVDRMALASCAQTWRTVYSMRKLTHPLSLLGLISRASSSSFTLRLLELRCFSA